MKNNVVQKNLRYIIGLMEKKVIVGVGMLIDDNNY